MIESEAMLEEFYGDLSRKMSKENAALHFYKKLNAGQKEAFNRIAQGIKESGQQKLFFVEGDGGCG